MIMMINNFSRKWSLYKKITKELLLPFFIQFLKLFHITNAKCKTSNKIYQCNVTTTMIKATATTNSRFLKKSYYYSKTQCEIKQTKKQRKQKL